MIQDDPIDSLPSVVLMLALPFTLSKSAIYEAYEDLELGLDEFSTDMQSSITELLTIRNRKGPGVTLSEHYNVVEKFIGLVNSSRSTYGLEPLSKSGMRVELNNLLDLIYRHHDRIVLYYLVQHKVRLIPLTVEFYHPNEISIDYTYVKEG